MCSRQKADLRARETDTSSRHLQMEARFGVLLPTQCRVITALLTLQPVNTHISNSQQYTERGDLWVSRWVWEGGRRGRGTRGGRRREGGGGGREGVRRDEMGRRKKWESENSTGVNPAIAKVH